MHGCSESRKADIGAEVGLHKPEEIGALADTISRLLSVHRTTGVKAFGEIEQTQLNSVKERKVFSMSEMPRVISKMRSFANLVS